MYQGQNPDQKKDNFNKKYDFRHFLFAESEILETWFIVMQSTMFGIVALVSVILMLKHRKILTRSSIILIVFLNL